MEKMPENLDSKLEQLLLEKSFEDLNDAEKTWVNSKITSGEYLAFRKILLASRKIFQESITSPDPRIKTALLEKLKTKSNKPSLLDQLKNIFYHPIPTWKVALTFLALMIGFSFYQNKYSSNAINKTYVQHSTELSENIVESRNDSLVKQVNYRSRSVKAEAELKNLFTGVH